MKVIIRNARIMGEDSPDNLYIRDGLITAPYNDPPDREIDVSGAALFPGLIDAHCHLRDPGYEYKEDIQSGTMSAAKGGYTSVCCMPNTNPVCDNASVVSSIISKSKKVGFTNVFPIGAASKGLCGKELAEIGLMKEAGIVAISNDGLPIEPSDLMRKVIEYASSFDLIVMNHCEDTSLSQGAMNEGPLSTRMGLRGIPTLAENIMISRDLLIAEYLNLPVHICHVSNKVGVQIIREAKARGVKVTAETCPHYFSLTEEAVTGYNTDAKMSPPLRTEEDRQAIIEGLADKTIDIIVTDHAPHHPDDKQIEFSMAEKGIVGFETAFALAYTNLVRKGRISLSRLIECMSEKPSEILKLGRGSIQIGSIADIACFDLMTPFVFDKNQMLSKSRNTPFHNHELVGKCILTIQGGQITYEELC
ncbi:MAG: dihydroorotase [Clostridiaceae bacterium]|nr:dihydroorotase [Clostridiaceae bacterium]